VSRPADSDGSSDAEAARRPRGGQGLGDRADRHQGQGCGAWGTGWAYGALRAARSGARHRPAAPVGAPGRPGDAKRPGPVGGAAAVGAARVTEAVRSARSTVSSAAARGPRRARLNLKRIDPWSVMKFSFAVSVVLFIVVVVATSVLYLALDAMGVWGEVNKSLSDW
jgi:hypothetical protein